MRETKISSTFDCWNEYMLGLLWFTCLNSASGRTSRMMKLFSVWSRNASFTSTLLTCKTSSYFVPFLTNQSRWPCNWIYIFMITFNEYYVRFILELIDGLILSLMKPHRFLKIFIYLNADWVSLDMWSSWNSCICFSSQFSNQNHCCEVWLFF